jgi:hypothetical protein
LDEVPEILHNRVMEIIGRYERPRIISISKFVTSPYKDKTVIRTTYTAHIQIGNYFLALKYGECSKSEWTDAAVTENGMIAAEIIEFVKQCDWLQYGVQEALKDGKGEGILPLLDL